ncbi:MAG TPA: HAMP domain-containing protein, partial [Thermoleophilia bacterium]|nr:HAMP domain-containing protein [Thermoleophilia bacterium]
MRELIRWNVRNRFVLAFLVVSVVPLLIFGSFVYSRTARALDQVERRDTLAQARGARAVLAQRLDEQVAYIRDYSVWDEFHTAMLTHRMTWIHDNVTGWVPANSDNDLVLVYDAKGRVFARGGTSTRSSLWATDLVQAARRGKIQSDLAVLNGAFYVLSAAPVVAQTHPSTPSGVLVFGERVSDRVLESINRFTGGEGALSVYTGGKLSAATDPAIATPSPAPDPAAVAAADVFTYGGYTNRLVPLRDRSGAMVAELKVSLRRDAFAAALRQINEITIAAFLAALLIAGAIGVLVALTISKPLRRLAAAATAMAHGDLHQELPTHRGDEIGSLAKAFNAMSSQVAARVDALSEKTRTLSLEISNLSAFGTTLTQTPDPHAELQRLSDMIRAMLDADTASVFLVYDGHTTREAFSGSKRCAVPPPAADKLADWVVLSQRALEVHDAEADEHLSALARATNQLRSFLVVPLARQDAVIGALAVGFLERREFGPEELPLLVTIGGQIATSLQNAEAYEKLDRMYLETVTALAAAMEAKDHYTASHADSLANMAAAVGARMGLNDGELRMVQYAAVLHDIGKIGIPGTILNKPAALTVDEFDQMAQHTI